MKQTKSSRFPWLRVHSNQHRLKINRYFHKEKQHHLFSKSSAQSCTEFMTVYVVRKHWRPLINCMFRYILACMGVYMHKHSVYMELWWKSMHRRFWGKPRKTKRLWIHQKSRMTRQQCIGPAKVRGEVGTSGEGRGQGRCHDTQTSVMNGNCMLPLDHLTPLNTNQAKGGLGVRQVIKQEKRGKQGNCLDESQGDH